MKNNIVIFLIFSIGSIYGQIGDVIWEENFNNLDNWMKITGNGSWGWGNGELEFYQEENVEITDVPDEMGKSVKLYIGKGDHKSKNSY
jgi:hypothetical protein